MWTPHPKQKQALKKTEFEVLYGGARGGGKTDAGIAWLVYDTDNPKLRSLIIRRNSTDLVDWIDRANLIYSHYGVEKKGNPPEFHWPSGAIFRIGHLKDKNAYTKYIGHEYQRMLIEELTLIPSEDDYLKLLSACRSTVEGLKPRVFLTTNPTGVGHSWVRKKFIDVAPPNTKCIDVETGRTKIFIPALIDDNPTLVERDPAYIQYLEGLKARNPNLYKAWRLGSWDVFAGQVFSEFVRDYHTIKPFIPKQEFTHFLSIDWGYSGRESDEGAFAAYASALIKAKHEDITFNRVITYKEWYDKYKTPNEWAEILYDQSLRKYKLGIGDSSMFNPQSDGSISITDLMQRKWNEINKSHWLTLKAGTKNRVSRVETIHNWLQIAPDGLPYWLISENCHHLIRTLPQLVYDEYNIEDVDTNQEDHPYDAISYGLSAIRFIPAHLGGIKPKEEFKHKVKPEFLEKIDLEEFEKAKPQKRSWQTL